MFVRLLLLFTIVPLTELFLLLELGRWVGPVPTIALVLATGALGAWLSRNQGLQVFRRAQQEWASGKMPTESIADGVLIFLAGAVLLTPGLLTDFAGFFLLTPFGRGTIRGALMRRFKANIKSRPQPVIIYPDD